MNATTQTDKRPAPTSERTSKTTRLTHTQRTALLKALADPKRFELLERIAKSSCPLGCTDAREALDIAPATLSHHIKELQNSGLIEVRREGKFHFLSVRPGVLEALASTLQALSPTYCNGR
jgi:ArsR family transcriptional regulator